MKSDQILVVVSFAIGMVLGVLVMLFIWTGHEKAQAENPDLYLMPITTQNDAETQDLAASTGPKAGMVPVKYLK